MSASVSRADGVSVTHLLEETSVLSLSWRRAATGACRLGVTLLPAAVTLTRIIALLLSR